VRFPSAARLATINRFHTHSHIVPALSDSLLAAITSAGGKRPSQQRGFASACTWGEVLQVPPY